MKKLHGQPQNCQHFNKVAAIGCCLDVWFWKKLLNSANFARFYDGPEWRYDAARSYRMANGEGDLFTTRLTEILLWKKDDQSLARVSLGAGPLNQCQPHQQVGRLGVSWDSSWAVITDISRASDRYLPVVWKVLVLRDTPTPGRPYVKEAM